MMGGVEGTAGGAKIMARNGTATGWGTALTGLTGVALALVLAGCSRTKVERKVAQPAKDPAAEVSKKERAVEIDPRFTQSFAEATRKDPPADGSRPPDKTLSGKSVGKLYTEVVSLWDTVRLASASGQRISYTAVLDTELGSIEIALNSDVAPNHVRNFIALTQAGFYEGLVFERTVREKAEGHPDLELLEAGCPTGTGDIGTGSLGYWLKPEFNDVTHDEGTVGACHGEEADTACCKFYILLSKAPFLDKNFTVFGKVTRGLDVARRIFSLPVRTDPDYPEGDRPVKPVVIRKVTIQPAGGGNAVAAAPNP
jgi:cyclophilin family peptidyl-prolyl cis-trans isomerase